jgi:uncharacterized damage-inducible protein DinB
MADDTLTTLFQHHRWANLQLLERCAGLTPEQLSVTLPGTFGAIGDTWQHLVLSEQSYVSRITTGQRLSRPDDARPLTMAEMRESLQTTGNQLIAWAVRVEPDDTVTIDWDGRPVEVPKTVLLTQAVNHATEHRAQIMAILTQLGSEPPELDGWAYFEQRHGLS